MFFKIYAMATCLQAHPQQNLMKINRKIKRKDKTKL